MTCCLFFMKFVVLCLIVLMERCVKSHGESQAASLCAHPPDDDGCEGYNICTKPCRSTFYPTQGPAFYFENFPVEEDVWVEIVKTTPSLLSELPIPMEIFRPKGQTSGIFSVEPIVETGTYNILVFQGEKTIDNLLAISKFCVGKF